MEEINDKKQTELDEKTDDKKKELNERFITKPEEFVPITEDIKANKNYKKYPEYTE